ncbi:MAG: hypothetical protein KBE25_03170 [Laribacter sp.]|nr:hypothetical protein [Laribacter sp.]MBP9608336.1 hypothetical protein [Laribacter sp.]
MKKEYSKLTVDIEQSIARAYDLNLSSKDRSEVKGHLAHILPKLRAPNTLIQPIKEALAFVHMQEAKNQSWKDWLGKPVLVALVTALITAPVSFYVGLSIKSSKAQECQASNSAASTPQGITSQFSGPAKAGR